MIEAHYLAAADVRQQSLATLICVAECQRHINWAFLAYGCTTVMGPLVVFGLVGALVVSLVASIRLANALHGTRWGVACGLLMFVPLANLITLLLLSSQATTCLRSAGVRVGFLGANSADLERLRQSYVNP